jgi:putative SOS response-associated peptidase YedK
MNELAERFDCPMVEPVMKPRYNVAPSQQMPVVVSSAGQRQLCLMQWGLVPFWAKDRSIGNKLINARLETIEEKPAFKAAYRRRRCLVPATGYYEWQKQAKGKQSFYIHMPDQKLFAFAGLWDEWVEPGGEILHSFTILTTEPVPAIAHLHNRMPYILLCNQESLWLQGQSPPPSAMQLETYEISTLVNRPINDLPDCIKPLCK